MVDTLKYLKKGGRVTPAAAMIGTVLNLKPVLTIQGGQAGCFCKSARSEAGKKVMLEAMKKDMETRFAEPRKKGLMSLMISYTYGQDEAVRIWMEEVQAAFPDMKIFGSPTLLKCCLPYRPWYHRDRMF